MFKSLRKLLEGRLAPPEVDASAEETWVLPRIEDVSSLPLDSIRRPWPSDASEHKIIFAVSMDGNAFLVGASEAVRNANDDCSHMDLTSWDDLPTAPGFYRATAKFWFQEGYFEGYPAPGESSYGWALQDCTKAVY